MKKVLSILIVSIFFISCSDNKKKNNEKSEIKTEEKESFKRLQNYAVVFKWATKDEKLVEENVQQQADQLLSMWKKKTVENVYFDSESKADKLSYFPNISFFLKAEDTKQAETILTNLHFVKKRIASYTIYPVGALWLKRSKEKVTSKSYVAVWNTVTKHDNSNIGEQIENTAKEQSDAVLKLWKEGRIENVYFDIEGTVKLNMKTDFVFFINTNSMEEAKKICDNLPFSKKRLASYKLQQVGVFWMGQYNQ
jgi:hypothetical protein